MRLFQDIHDKYCEWILMNPSFRFVYIEKRDHQEEFDDNI